MPQKETVRVYDFATGSVVTIPAAELAPGMVRARVEGIDGEVWIDGSTLASGQHQHPHFEGERKELMQVFAEVFADVYPKTPEEWEDGFRRDVHVDREIAMWQGIAHVFLHFTEGRGYDRDQKNDIFRVVLAYVNNGPDRVLQTVSPRTLSRNRVKDIIAHMDALRREGEN
jgi:hypothetical protein